ncbi:MAG: hypothetical protein JRI44_06060 [Deltaproteobacteria bacterium]|nr:hypothetical protein [Deltaproteobacteria bacterium]
MKDLFCFKCKKPLPPGSLKYIITISIIADFDGVLPESDDLTDRELENLIKEIMKSNPKKVEHDVYHTMAFLVCKKCKDQFLKDPLHIGEAKIKKVKESSGIVH